MIANSASFDSRLDYAIAEKWRPQQCSLRSLGGRLQEFFLGELGLFLIPLPDSYGCAADTCHVANDAQTCRQAVEEKKEIA